MAPKKAKTTEAGPFFSLAAEPAEEGPRSLEDLPNDVLGEIVRKLEGFDKLRLTIASPTVRRLCTGPKADPGALGPVVLNVSEGKPIELLTRPYPAVFFSVDPSHSDFDSHLPVLLKWVQSRSRAISKFCFQIHEDSFEPEIVYGIGSSLLSALSEANYKGSLRLNLNLLDSTTAPHLAPLLSFIDQAFPSNYNVLRLADLALTSPVVLETLQNLSSFEGVYIESASGLWPAECFSKCSNLQALHVHVGGTFNFQLSASLRSIRCLSFSGMEARIFRSLLGSLSAPQIASLESVKLDWCYPIQELPKLSALSTLPNLSTLSVSLATVLSRDAPLHFSISLPRLSQLSVRCGLYHEGQNYVHTSFSFPLTLFSTPQLRVLELSTIYFLQASAKVSVSASIPSLAPYPHLEALKLAHDPVDVYDCPLAFDLSSVDFREAPNLAFLSSEGDLILPRRPRAPRLPLEKCEFQFSSGRRLHFHEFGNAAVFAKYERRSDFP